MMAEKPKVLLNTGRILAYWKWPENAEPTLYVSAYLHLDIVIKYAF